MTQKKTRKVEVKFCTEIDEKFYDEFQSIISHHLDRLLSLDEYPEIVSVYNGTVQDILESGA